MSSSRIELRKSSYEPPSRASLLAQLLEADAVLLGNAGDGAIDFLVGHAHAGLFGAGELQLHQDQALEHLPFQHVARRQLVLATGVLAG